MRLTAGDAAAYPKFAQYVKQSIPTVYKVPKIRTALQTHGSLSPAAAKTALTWGHDPLIVVKDLNIHTCGTAGSAYGCFRPGSPRQIEIRTDLVTDFEAGKFSTGKNKNSAGKIVYVVGATLLHELCHWGNQKAGVNEATEQGLAFETTVYGITIW